MQKYPVRNLNKISLVIVAVLGSSHIYGADLPASSSVNQEVTCSSALIQNSDGLFGSSSIGDLDQLTSVIGKIRTEKAKAEKDRIMAELKAAQNTKDIAKQVSSYEALVRLEPGNADYLVGLATAKTDGAVAYLVGVEKLLGLKEGYDRSLVRSLLNQADDLLASAKQDLQSSIKGMPTGPQVVLPANVTQLNTRQSRIKSYMSQIQTYMDYSYIIPQQSVAKK